MNKILREYFKPEDKIIDIYLISYTYFGMTLTVNFNRQKHTNKNDLPINVNIFIYNI